jgi:hypothetical protein
MDRKAKRRLAPFKGRKILKGEREIRKIRD